MNLIKLKNRKIVDRENLVYRINEYTYSFKNVWTRNTYRDRDIYNGTITLKKVDIDQSDLLVEILKQNKKKFRKQIKPKNPEKKKYS